MTLSIINSLGMTSWSVSRSAKCIKRKSGIVLGYYTQDNASRKEFVHSFVYLQVTEPLPVSQVFSSHLGHESFVSQNGGTIGPT